MQDGKTPGGAGSAVAWADSILERRRAGVRDVQRRQLIEGFAAAVVAKGYAATTIADIVRHSRTSKTTFYEHFADKEAVHLALHETVCAAVEASVKDALALTASAPLRQRVEAVTTAYLGTLTEDPARLVQVQVQAQVATAAAVSARLESRTSFADVLRSALSAPDGEGPSEVAVRLVLAGTTEVVVEAVVGSSAEGPGAAVDAVLELRDPLIEAWTRLFTPPGSLTTQAAPTQSLAPPQPATATAASPRPASSDWRPGF